MEGSQQAGTGNGQGASPRRELWLFTMRFPYGADEAFIESELPQLLRHFDKVICIPEIADAPIRVIPDRVEVIVPIQDMFRPASWLECSIHWRVLLRLLHADLGHLIRRPSLFRSRFARARQLIHRFQILRHGLLKSYDPSGVMLYSYWTTEWATLLGLMRMDRPDLRFVSRVHGFDLFEERPGDLPFRKIQLDQAERIYAVSEFALHYIREKHPAYAAKIHLARLGTADHGAAPLPSKGSVTIVSCSSLIPRKRVHLIAEALPLVGLPLRWVHFGNGPLHKKLLAQVAHMPDHVQVHFMGHAQNRDLMEWYKREPVDVMVHMARAEGGVAVVLQEAASFGIPIVAADAGGVREVVVPATGILLPNGPSSTEVADAIREVLQGTRSTPAAREQVRNYWNEHFRADVNHSAFCKDLLSLMPAMITPELPCPKVI